MAGNYGKFKDRMPIICAAGKKSNDPLTMDTVAKTFKEYSIDDAIDALKSNAHIREDGFKDPIPKPPIDNMNFYRTNTEISGILKPGVTTRYQSLLGDLEETIHDSYWNKELGKISDPTAGLPRGIVPVLETFGIKSDKTVKGGDLINPPKSPYEVLRDSQFGHEMYVKTHGDYNPGEQTHRNYIAPFDKTKRFGKRSRYDYRGIWVKCSCQWHINKPFIHCSKRQTDFVKQTKPSLGEPLTPNHNIECVPQNHVFGKPTERGMFGVEELLKGADYQPCLFKRDLLSWLSMLNKLRMVLKKKVSKGYINFNEFYRRVLYYDKEKNGLLTKDLFYDLCINSHIMFSMKQLEPLLKLLDILKDDGMVDYKNFIDLLNPNLKPPEIVPVKDLPESALYYLTVFQEMACDDLFIDNSKLPPAGTPSSRTDLARPRVTEGIYKADLESLPDATSIKTVLNPSIYTRWGLNFRDFFLPRKPETLKKLFEKVGYNFSNDTFDALWKEGVAQDGTGLCCVDTFKKLLEKYRSPPKIRVDEMDCRDVYPHM